MNTIYVPKVVGLGDGLKKETYFLKFKVVPFKKRLSRKLYPSSPFKDQ